MSANLIHKYSLGILGGTFDPIHLGHIYLAINAYKLCKLQKIILIPCYQSPHKPKTIASAYDRLNMINLAVKNFSFIEVSDYEIKQEDISYTKNTLQYLKYKYNDSLTLIMGADTFNKFDQWDEWYNIIKMANILVMNRNSQNITIKNILLLLEKKIFQLTNKSIQISNFIHKVQIKPINISSTMIRSLIKNKENFLHLVNHNVANYIKSRKLYY